MRDDARTVLVVTDDPCFTGPVAELLLRAGIRTLRFARTHDVLAQARELAPDLILVHIPRACLDAGWTCYAQLQSDAATAGIPLLLFTPAQALAERAVGARSGGPAIEGASAPDRLIVQVGVLVGAGMPAAPRGDAWMREQRFPTGRDDL